MVEEDTVSPPKYKRSGKVFYATASSIKKLMKDLATGVRRPSSIYVEATAAAGSMQSSAIASDLPRDVIVFVMLRTEEENFFAARIM